MKISAGGASSVRKAEIFEDLQLRQYRTETKRTTLWREDESRLCQSRIE